MRRIDEKEILRRTELLSKIEPRQESIERAMMRARQALAEHKFETTGVWRTIMTSGWTKLVAAAVIIAGVLIGIKVLSSEQNAEQNIAKKEETPKQQVIQDSVGEKAQQRELKVSVELAQAEALYRAKDIAGLVAMLKSGEPETKAAVANYLAKIGDVSALEALKKLSEQWEGEEAENPFAAAVRQIEERAADETAGYEAQSKEETKGEWMKVRVIAKDTGEPVPFADIRTYNNGSAYYETDANGILILEFGDKRPDSLNVFALEPGWVSMSIAFRKEYALGVPKQFTFALEKGTVIGGVVHDPNGKPLEGVKVSVRVHEDMDSDRATIDVRGQYETDAKGRWRCDIVPAVLDQIGVSFTCAGFSGKSLWTKDIDMDALRGEQFVATLERGMTLAGFVYDIQGNPVEGASVLMGMSHYTNEPKARARTSEKGRFEFPDISPSGKQMLTVTADGYAPQMIQVPMSAAMEPVELFLEAGHTIRGRVVDLQGKAVEGATAIAGEWHGHQVLDWRATADSQGRFAWTDAPADEIEINVYKKGFMGVDDTMVVASEAEYEFVIEEPITVRGKVVDAETGEPVEKFKLIPGYRWKTPPGTFTSIAWQDGPGHLRTFTGGEYEQTFTSDAEFWGIRIEAEGYMPTESRKIERHEKNIVIDFELEKASGPKGVIKLAGGETVEGAEVYLVTSYFYMENGWVEGRESMPFTRTDAEGRFAFKPQLGHFIYVVVCDEGFAMVSKEDFAQSDEIVVEPWATVVGDFYVGSRPVTGSRLRLDYPRLMNQSIGYSASSTAVTDANGMFVFEKVIPGEFRVSRDHFEVAPGQTLEIHLGGDGRTVKGRFIPPQDFDGMLEAQYGTIHIQRNVPRLEEDDIPKPSGFESMSYDELRAWLEEFAKSDDGQKWLSEIEVKYHYDHKTYDVRISDAGSFSVDNVRPGDYFMKGEVYAKTAGRYPGPDFEKKLAKVYCQFTVAEITEYAPIDETVELGNIQMMPAKLEVGMFAPVFEVNGITGGTVRLLDYRGKVVLLSFYQPGYIENSEEMQNLKRIYSRFKEDGRFALLGMLLTEPLDYTSAVLVQESKLGWTHGTAEFYNSREYVEYDIGGQPWNVLIGADGKVLAIGVKGEELVAAVEEALRAQ